MSEVNRKPSSPGRPLQTNKKRVRVSFTLHPDDVGWLKQQAAQAKISTSSLLDRLIHSTQEDANIPETLADKLAVRIPVPYEQLRTFCKKYQIKKLAFFGSVLTDKFSLESDVDVLVEFYEERRPGLFTLVAAEKELSEILQRRKVDLKTAAELSRYFRKEVIQKAKVIYAA
jgi:predicted nucleotidyltransferase